MQYRDVVGIEGYRVSDEMSLQTRWTKPYDSAPVRLWTLGDAWREVDTWTKDGRYVLAYLLGKQYRCHLLVLAAFVGPRPPRMEGRHKDGDRHNWRLDNLEYGTRKDNMQDAIKHGTHTCLNNRCLSKETAREIRELYRSGKSNVRVLTLKYNACRRTIYNIINEKNGYEDEQ